jgi:hypothetical protein
MQGYAEQHCLVSPPSSSPSPQSSSHVEAPPLIDGTDPVFLAVVWKDLEHVAVGRCI